MSVTRAPDTVDTIDAAAAEPVSEDQASESLASGPHWPRPGGGVSCNWLRAGGTCQLFFCSIMAWLAFMAVVASVVFVAGKSSEVGFKQKHGRLFASDRNTVTIKKMQLRTYEYCTMYKRNLSVI